MGGSNLQITEGIEERVEAWNRVAVEGHNDVALLKARADRPSLEVRQRIDRLLERLDGAPKWQALRAFEVLEWLGTPDVRAVLRELAGGDDSSLLTRQATATLARLQSHAGD